MFFVLGTVPPGTAQTLDALKKAGVPVFAYGSFITITVNFIILAFIIFAMIKQVNRLRAAARAPEPEPVTPEGHRPAARDPRQPEEIGATFQSKTAPRGRRFAADGIRPAVHRDRLLCLFAAQCLGCRAEPSWSPRAGQFLLRLLRPLAFGVQVKPAGGLAAVPSLPDRLAAAPAFAGAPSPYACATWPITQVGLGARAVGLDFGSPGFGVGVLHREREVPDGCAHLLLGGICCRRPSSARCRRPFRLA